jgi:hypothetical protein
MVAQDNYHVCTKVLVWQSSISKSFWTWPYLVLGILGAGAVGRLSYLFYKLQLLHFDLKTTALLHCNSGRTILHT